MIKHPVLSVSNKENNGAIYWTVQQTLGIHNNHWTELIIQLVKVSQFVKLSAYFKMNKTFDLICNQRGKKKQTSIAINNKKINTEISFGEKQIKKT